ncbi:microbial aspartic proteinase [Thozetella sp. PMI_491]|nr:microbial aspartic proteinase [Thozetella sp. PMI_491]
MISIQQVRNEQFQFNGPVEVYKTLNKFKAPIPESLSKAVRNITARNLEGRATGSASASPVDSYDSSYVIPVSIGTPPQVLNLNVDTGSSDLWVFSSLTPKSQVNGQSIYTPSKSKTSKQMAGETWSISYSDGSSSSGNVYTDVVSVGALTVSAQAVEAASTVSSEFTADSKTHGLLGLGFDNVNTASPKQVPTFFSNAKSSLAAPVFTADLKYHAAGKYNFGYIDTSVPTSAITYVPVNTANGYWEFISSGYSIGSGSFVSTNVDGIADTGTSLVYLPNMIINSYYKQIKGATNNANYGGWTFPCSSTIPNFTFGAGKARITIPGKYINYGQVSSSLCFGGLQSNDGIGFSIFGDIALKSAFVVFNGATPPTLGFATKTLN